MASAGSTHPQSTAQPPARPWSSPPKGSAHTPAHLHSNKPRPSVDASGRGGGAGRLHACRHLRWRKGCRRQGRVQGAQPRAAQLLLMGTGSRTAVCKRCDPPPGSIRHRRTQPDPPTLAPVVCHKLSSEPACWPSAVGTQLSCGTTGGALGCSAARSGCAAGTRLPEAGRPQQAAARLGAGLGGAAAAVTHGVQGGTGAPCDSRRRRPGTGPSSLLQE